jgi:hypothetical protein
MEPDYRPHTLHCSACEREAEVWWGFFPNGSPPIMEFPAGWLIGTEYTEDETGKSEVTLYVFCSRECVEESIEPEAH